MQVDIRQHRRDHTSLRRAQLGLSNLPILKDPGFQPLVDRSTQNSVSHPLVEKAPQMSRHQVVEGPLDVRFQDPASLHLRESLPEHLQRLVRRSPGAKPPRAVQEVLLVDRFQHHRDRPLQNLVLKGRYPDRPLSAVAFRHVRSLHRRRPVRSGLEPLQQVRQIPFQVLAVFLGGLPVNPGRPVPAPPPVGLPQELHVDHVGQGRVHHLSRFSRQFRYPLKSRGHGSRARCLCHVSPKRLRLPDLPLPSSGSLGSVSRLHRYFREAPTPRHPSRRTSLPSLGGTSAFTRSVRSLADECAAKAWSW